MGHNLTPEKRDNNYTHLYHFTQWFNINAKQTDKQVQSPPMIWPGNVEGLFWFQSFINLSPTYLDTYPLTYSPGTHTEQNKHALINTKLKKVELFCTMSSAKMDWSVLTDPVTIHSITLEY